MVKVLLLFFIVTSVQATEPTCRAKSPMPTPLTPKALNLWLGGNGHLVKDVGEFICCLPEKYRDSSFLIAHSSNAGQPGSPESPRIILHAGLTQGDAGDNEENSENESMIFTVNGGAKYLPQHDAVEMLHVKNKNSELNYHDMAMSKYGIFLVSEPNPTNCMVCHGEKNRVPKQGARPLFDPFGHWPRFVGGVGKCNPEEDKLQAIKQKRALEAVRDNPRFACLDKSGVLQDLKRIEAGRLFGADAESPLVHGGSLSGFDSFLFEMNSDRIARVMVDTPDYAAYKFAIVGQDVCADMMMEIEKWIPAHVLERHSNLSFVKPEVARARSLKDVEEIKGQMKAEAKAHREIQKGEAADKANVFKKQLDPGANIYSCLKDENRESTLGGLPLVMKIKNPGVKAYMLDQFVRFAPIQARGGMSGVLRFLFEGRGISIGQWSLDLNSTQYRGAETPVQSLVKREPLDSVLRKAMAPNDQFDQEDPFARNQKVREKRRDAAEKQTCENLRKASWDALSRLPPVKASNAAASSPATR